MVSKMGAERPGYASPKSMIFGRTITALPVSPVRPALLGILAGAAVAAGLLLLLRGVCVVVLVRVWAFGPITACKNLLTPISGSPTVARMRFVVRARSFSPISVSQDSISPANK